MDHPPTYGFGCLFPASAKRLPLRRRTGVVMTRNSSTHLSRDPTERRAAASQPPTTSWNPIRSRWSPI